MMQDQLREHRFIIFKFEIVKEGHSRDIVTYSKFLRLCGCKRHSQFMLDVTVAWLDV